MNKIDKDFLTPGESIIATTFYTYGSHLVITNKRLVGKRISKIGRRTFEGKIPLSSISSVKYSPGIPIFTFSPPSLWIEHELPDGSIEQSRLRFQQQFSLWHLCGA
ncbi:MAG: hypothetical protein GY832_36515 [Chloroflexi bacterium]|nr:hypothetical protein [Chloroflexota bacterium]